MAINLTQTQIDLAHTKYVPLWEQDWQQASSRLKAYLTPEPDCKGKYTRFHRIGGTDVHEYTRNDQSISFDSLKVGDYGMKPRKFFNAIPINDDDNADAFDLEIELAQIRPQQAAAAERFMDMAAIGVVKDKDTGLYRMKNASDEGARGGIFGTSYSGETGENAHELDLSIAGFKAGTGNLIPLDYETTGAGVSSALAGTLVDRLKYALRRLAENEAFNATDPNELCFVCTPGVAQYLQSLEMSVNHDYHIGDIGSIGRPVFNPTLGCTVIQTNMLPKMDTIKMDGTTEVKDCIMCGVWLRSQVGYSTFGRSSAEWTLKDINDKAAMDYYSRVRGRIGVGRKRDDAVFVLPCLAV